MLCDRIVDAARTTPSIIHPRFVGLLERRNSIGGNYFEVTDGDPGYLTDLRMKRYADAEAYFLENINRLAHRLGADGHWDLASADACVAGVHRMLRPTAPSPPQHAFRSWLEGEVTERPDIVAHVMCFYVNSLGSWDDAYMIALEVLHIRHLAPRNEDAARLLVLCAYACAIAKEDERARILYDAGVTGLNGAYDRFFVHMRMATVELKRLRDYPRFQIALAGAKHEASQLGVNGHTSEDASFAEALVLNLRALSWVREGDLSKAAVLVEDAFAMMCALPDERLTLRPAVAGRYRFMVNQNRGLLHARRGDWTAAAGHFGDALCLARATDPDSVSEGLSVHGYALLRLRQPRSARASLEEAERLLALDMRPKRLEKVRALLAVACADMGDERSAARWLALADT
jgi:tetratricopeptide (TPR) repeat protein